MKHHDELRGQPSDDDPFSLTISPRRNPSEAGDALHREAESPLEGSTGARLLCRFCDHANPPGSTFCNSCGGQLNLRPCPDCGAIAETGAAACYQCGARLERPQGDEPATVVGRASLPAPAVTPTAEAGRVEGRPKAMERAGLGLPLLVLAAGVVLATAGLALYYTRVQQGMDTSLAAGPERSEQSRIRPIGQAAPSATASAGERAATRGHPAAKAAATTCSEAVSALGLCSAVAPAPKPVSHTADARAPETPPAGVPAAR